MKTVIIILFSLIVFVASDETEDYQTKLITEGTEFVQKGIERRITRFL